MCRRYGEARHALELALTFGSKNSQQEFFIYNTMGIALTYEESYRDALEAFDCGDAVSPGNAQILHNRG